MSDSDDNQRLLVIVASPSIRDLELLWSEFFSRSTDADDETATWSGYRFNASLLLSSSAQQVVAEAALVYLEHIGYGPEKTGDYESFPTLCLEWDDTEPDPDPPPPPIVLPLEWRHHIYSLQDLVQMVDLPIGHPDSWGPHRMATWVHDDAVTVLQIPDGCWIIGEGMAWNLELEDTNREEISATITRLTDSRWKSEVQRPADAEETYYLLTTPYVQNLWLALEQAPQQSEVLKAKTLIRSTANADGKVYILCPSPRVEIEVRAATAAAVVTSDVPTLHGGWIQHARLDTLAALHTWTEHLSQSTFDAPVTLSPTGRIEGKVFSPEHGTYVDAAHCPAQTPTICVNYRNVNELKILERRAVAAWEAANRRSGLS